MLPTLRGGGNSRKLATHRCFLSDFDTATPTKPLREVTTQGLFKPRGATSQNVMATKLSLWEAAAHAPHGASLSDSAAIKLVRAASEGGGCISGGESPRFAPGNEVG